MAVSADVGSGKGLITIDLSSCDLAHSASLIRQACLDGGFFYVINHGIRQELFEELFDRSRTFFQLPLEEKMKALKNKDFKGYTPLMDQMLDPSKQSKGDCKEGYYIGFEGAKDDPNATKRFFGPNVWPSADILPGWRQTMEKYYQEALSVGRRVARLIALSLNLEADFFDKPEILEEPIAILRLLHYVDEISKPELGIYGAGAHSDFGLLTLLVTDEVSGLQICKNKDAEQQIWEDVHPLRGAFIVNIGDMLERWTNGNFRSTLHRVLLFGQERYSRSKEGWCFSWSPPPSVSVSPSLGHIAPSASSKALGASQPTLTYDVVAARQQAQLRKYPLCKYVTKKQGLKAGVGGNVLWSCNFCKGEFKSTYLRVKGHLLGLSYGIGACKKISPKERMDLERDDAAGFGNVVAASRKTSKNEDPLPFLRNANSSRFGREVEIQPTKKREAQTCGGPMDKIFQREQRDEVDLTMTFIFYLNFISFNVSRSPLFIEMCRALVDRASIGYVPPSSEKLRTTLLVKARKEVDKILQPIKSSWISFGVSIVSDGWTDTTRHPLINFMVYSQNGPVFLKAVDALGKYKDAQYMGELFIKVIEEVGVESCVQIITDNAPFCKAAGLIVETKYPQIFWTPCIVHCLNLALKSIASNVTWIGNLIEDARHIRNFVQNHTNALTVYKEYTCLSLLKIVDTQFASSFIMLKRLKEVKAALGAMVISDLWSFWRKTDQTASKKVKDTVLDDGWWERVDLTIKIMNPIISFLRFSDTGQPILGEVYEGWDSMIVSVKTIVMENECPGYETSAESLWSNIQDILISRWDKNCTPLHCLAHSLNPNYYSQEWLRGGTSHKCPPHMYGEISQWTKIAFRRIFQDSASFLEVEEGFVEFSTGTRRFGGYDVLGDRGVKGSYAWWATHEVVCPILQQLALRILSQITSSSCCERNWSTYGNSLKKSKLEQSRAETMVYVHTNLRLIYRQRQEWLKGKTKRWDVFPDDMVLDDSVELALANMDLNDPVLEPLTFDDEPEYLEGSSSTPTNAAVDLGLGIEEEDGIQSDGNGSDGDYDIEDMDY